jgi:phosphomannomutase
MRIVIDASNGMAGTMRCPRSSARRGKNRSPGWRSSELNFDNSKGEFAHEPNPLVASEPRADAGARGRAGRASWACASTATRTGAWRWTRRAAIVPCDHLTAVAGAHFLKERPGAAVIYDLRSTKAVEEEIRKHGGSRCAPAWATCS